MAPVELVPVDRPDADDPGQGRRRARRRQRRRRRRRRWRRSARRRRAGPLHRLARRRRADGGCHLGERDHRHRLQPRPRPPVARLAGRHRVHRGRRPATPDLLRRDPPTSACRCSATPARRRRWPSRSDPSHARASAYGEPFAYRPEDRAVMAIDGDPATAWLVADRADPVGERIQLDVSKPIDHLTLTQAPGAAEVRHIGRVTIAVDGRAPFDVDLGDDSLGAGQRVDLPPTTGPSTITITIDSVVVPDQTLGPALAAVGFSEVDTGLGPTVEVVAPAERRTHRRRRRRLDAGDLRLHPPPHAADRSMAFRPRAGAGPRARAPGGADVRAADHGAPRPAVHRRRARHAARDHRPAGGPPPHRRRHRRRLGARRRGSGDVVADAVQRRCRLDGDVHHHGTDGRVHDPPTWWRSLPDHLDQRGFGRHRGRGHGAAARRIGREHGRRWTSRCRPGRRP